MVNLVCSTKSMVHRSRQFLKVIIHGHGDPAGLVREEAAIHVEEDLLVLIQTFLGRALCRCFLRNGIKQ